MRVDDAKFVVCAGFGDDTGIPFAPDQAGGNVRVGGKSRVGMFRGFAGEMPGPQFRRREFVPGHADGPAIEGDGIFNCRHRGPKWLTMSYIVQDNFLAL